MNEETDNQIDPSVIDDMPDSVKRSLAEFINKKGGNIPVPEKKGSTGVTNTKILRVLTGSLQKVQGQLTTIDNRLAQQNALIQSNLKLTGGLLNAIEAQDSLLASKIDALTDAYEAQNALLVKQADLAEDRRSEARLERQADNNFVELPETAGGARVTSPALKAIRRSIQRLSRVLTFLAPERGIGIKSLGRFGKKALINSLGKRLYKQVAKFAISSGAVGLTRSVTGKVGSKFGPKIASAILKGTRVALPLFIKGVSLIDQIGTKRAASWFVKGTQTKNLPAVIKESDALKNVPKFIKKSAGKRAVSTVTKEQTKRAIARGATYSSRNRVGKVMGRGAGALAQDAIAKMTGKAAPKVVASAGGKAAAGAMDKAVKGKTPNILQRALLSAPVRNALAKKLGAETAEKLTARLASKLVPGFGTIYGAVEGIARGMMGDWKGMFLSFGGAIPAAGVGFAMLDLFREIDIPAYERHIEPNFPMPSDENFTAFFMDALGIGPDQYETGGATKPGTAILHGTELITHKNADPATALYSPIISGILGSTTAYMRQAGPSASYIAPLYNREAGKLSRQFGITHVNAVSGAGGSFVGTGSRMDQYEKRAAAEKPYYAPAGGPEGEDGEPQANKEGMLGMIARFFGFPMRSGEDVNSDFTNLGNLDSREGLSEGDPTGGRKTASELGTHLKGLRDKLPVTGQIHRHPDHPPWSQNSGHRAMSMHYSGRALDIGGFSPSTPQTADFPGSSGADEQAPVIREILKWNKAKGVSPVELVHGSPAYRGTGSYREYPDSHHHHVHIAYKNGGLTYDKPHVALMGEEGEEIVIPHAQSTGVARDHLLAVADAQTQKEVVSAYAKFTPDILMYDEEEEQMQTTFIINMTKPVISGGGGSTAPSAIVATGGRMHGASRSLILQSLY